MPPWSASSSAGGTLDPLARSFRDLIALFHNRGVRFLVAGGYALSFHGFPRYTKDIDLWIEPTTDNAQRLLEALDDFGFCGIGLQLEDFTQPDQIVQLGREPNCVDLLTSLKALSFAEAYETRQFYREGSVEIPYLARAALIANKKAVARPQDLVDVTQLEAQD